MTPWTKGTDLDFESRPAAIGAFQRCTALVVLYAVMAPWTHAQRLNIRSYSVADGLPDHSIEASAQLGSGAMVFLTQRGVAFYDGAHWTTETPFPSEPARPWRLATGHDNSLLAFVGYDCWRRSEGTWTILTKAPIPSSRSSTLFIVRQDESSHLVVVDKVGQLHLFDGKSWRTVPSPTPGTIFHAAVMVSERCFVGSNRGLLEFNFQSGTWNAWDLELPNASIISVALAPQAESLWLVGDTWVIRLDGIDSRKPRIGLNSTIPPIVHAPLAPALTTPKPDSRSAPRHDFPSVADLAGGIYLGSGFAIFYFNPITGLQTLSVDESGLNTQSMTCTMRDREGNVWICGPRGANKLTSRRIQAYNRTHGLLSNEVSAAFQRSDGTIILGHGGGMTQLGPDTKTIILSADSVANRVMDLAEDASGRLWFAAGYLGLGLMNRDGSIDYPQNSSRGSLVAVKTADDGDFLWIGTDYGLYRYDKTSWQRVLLTKASEPNQVRKLTKGRDNELLVATANQGVFALSGGATSHWTSDDFELRKTYTILRDSEGVIWVGTRKGLARANSQGQLIVSQHPPLDRPIYALTEDSKGQLWIGSDIGIHCWNKHKLRSFDTSDGVLGQECNRGAAMISKDGRVWFGTDRGINVFDERFDTPPVHGPTISLDEVEANGEFYDLVESHTFSSKTRSLTFEFTAISFVNEDSLLIQSRLQGWDSDWSEPNSLPSREIRYTNLPGGDYQLHMRAIDVNGRQSSVVSSAVLRIQDPFWLRGWFIATYSGAFLLMVTVLVGWILQRRYSRWLRQEVRTQTTAIRKMEREQEKLLRLESLGLLAGGIAHDFNNLLTSITANISLLESDAKIAPQGHASIRDIGAASDKARALASQLLTFSRGGAPIKKPSSIGNVIEECARFSLRGTSVHSECRIADDLLTVNVDTGQISQVINNIMINARQAMTNGGTVRVHARNEQLSPTDKFVVIEITDEGPGIPPDILDRIFEPYFSTKGTGNGIGLTTAFSIIQRHSGTLTVQSKVGTGTTFRITLPACHEVAPSPPTTPSDVSVPKLAQTSLLVMDDEAAIRRIIRKILERAGCSVVEAEDGSTATRLYEEAHQEGHPFDAVIMDLTVPGKMGGLEATSIIIKCDKHARVILASGYSSEATPDDCHEQGFVGRLSKPFTADDLLLCVSRALDLDP